GGARLARRLVLVAPLPRFHPCRSAIGRTVLHPGAAPPRAPGDGWPLLLLSPGPGCRNSAGRPSRGRRLKRPVAGEGSPAGGVAAPSIRPLCPAHPVAGRVGVADRKSTRLNSSHVKISYAVFCL